MFLNSSSALPRHEPISSKVNFRLKLEIMTLIILSLMTLLVGFGSLPSLVNLGTDESNYDYLP